MAKQLLEYQQNSKSQNSRRQKYKMLNMEIAPWPVFGDDEIAAVNDVLKSGIFSIATEPAPSVTFSPMTTN